MNLNVTSVELFLSNWFFPLMGGIMLSVPPALKGILAGLCPRFHVGKPVRAWAVECHRPVPHLREGFLEPDIHSRELCLLSLKWVLIS